MQGRPRVRMAAGLHVLEVQPHGTRAWHWMWPEGHGSPGYAVLVCASGLRARVVNNVPAALRRRR